MSKNTQYNESSIEILRGLLPVQKRPSMYIGNVGNSGYHHLIWEILDNSTDEAGSGNARNIALIHGKDGSITIVDDGRGIPVGKHPTEKIPTVDVVFTMLHAGGKFSNEKENSAFKNSSGLHGVGASVVNALSEYIEVIIRREGKEYKRNYKNGDPVGEIEITNKDIGKKTGTVVKFKPNKKYFPTVDGFQKEIVVKRLKELAFLNKGVGYKYIWHEKDGTSSEEMFRFNNGLVDFINNLLTDRQKLHEPIYISGEKIGGCDADIIFAYDDKWETQKHSYANNVNTHEHGVHMNAALDGIAKVIENICTSEKLLKDMDVAVNKSDIEEGLNLIVSVKLNEPQFEGQTKGKLNNEEIRKPLGEWIVETLTKEFKSNKEVGKIIAHKVAESIRSRDAAKKAKAIAIKKGGADFRLKGKFSECSSKVPEQCEMIIVEGDSALGTANNARNRKFQAILPLRGKVLNTGAKSLNSLFDNKEISTIISALGVKLGRDGCDLTNLRYHKVILISDPDVDGLHIANLLFTLFYKFMRPLIENGHLYIADLPLYRIKYNKKTIYLKDDKALEDFKKKHTGHIDLSRFKGLGEMDVTSFAELAMNVNTRNIKKITIENFEETSKLLQDLMGDEASTRKEFLMENLNFNSI